MGIDGPGKDVLPPGIDDFIGRIVQIGSDGLDFIAFGKHISRVAAGGGYDGSTLK